MMIETTSEQLAGQVKIGTAFPIVGDVLEPQYETDVDGKATDKKKLFEGKPQYRLDVSVKDVEKGYDVRNVSIKVLQRPGRIEAGEVKFAGKVWITPYVTAGGRQGYSIVAERVVENAAQPAK